MFQTGNRVRYKSRYKGDKRSEALYTVRSMSNGLCPSVITTCSKVIPSGLLELNKLPEKEDKHKSFLQKELEWIKWMSGNRGYEEQSKDVELLRSIYGEPVTITIDCSNSSYSWAVPFNMTSVGIGTA